MLRTYLLLIATAGLLMACGESDVPQEKAMTKAVEEKAVQLPADAEAVTTSDVMEKADTAMEEVKAEVVAEVEAVTEEVAAVAGDKPYQLVDGAISANAIEGWKTYNGGGCGACHGKGGIGAVGPNLAQSVTQKLSKEEFVKIVTKGKPGTLMRPNSTNKRVMDNMDNLYAYLVARGDDVLGPGNLIKMPLGK